MAIMRKGKVLTPRQQKAYVQNLTGWNDKQYKSEYNKLRNRAVNYERLTGMARGSINVRDLLANSVSRAYYGDKQTHLYNAVIQTTSASTSRALTSASRQKAEKAAFEYIENRYGSALKKSQMARATYEALKAAGVKDAALIEDEITASLRRGKQLGQEYKIARESALVEGIFVPWTPDTL